MKDYLNIVLFFLVLIFQSTLSAQKTIDYTELSKKVIHVGCTQTNIDSVDLTLKELLEIDSTQISKGLYDYYFDLGSVYYMKSFMHKQKEFHDHVYYCNYKCISIDNKKGDAYHEIAVIAYMDKKYALATTSIRLYKKYTEKEYWDKDLISFIENHSAKRIFVWGFNRATRDACGRK